MFYFLIIGKSKSKLKYLPTKDFSLRVKLSSFSQGEIKQSDIEKKIHVFHRSDQLLRFLSPFFIGLTF